MADYIEGKRPVIEALRTGVPMRRIMMADNAKRDPLINDIQRKAKRFGVEIELVPRKALDDLSDHGSHQGVIAEAKPFQYLGINELIQQACAYADEHVGRKPERECVIPSAVGGDHQSLLGERRAKRRHALSAEYYYCVHKDLL